MKQGRRGYETFGAARREESAAKNPRYRALHPEHNSRSMLYVDCVDAEGRQFELVNAKDADATLGRVAFDYILPRGVDQLNVARHMRDTLELIVPSAAGGRAVFEIDGFGAIMPRQRFGRVFLVMPDTIFIDRLRKNRADGNVLVRRAVAAKRRKASLADGREGEGEDERA